MKKCELLSEQLKVDVVCGDATLPPVLEEAGIKKIDVFLGLTDDDYANAMCTLLAKNYGVEKIFARIRDEDHIETCKKLGINIIDPADIIAHSINTRLRGEEFLNFEDTISREAEFRLLKVDLKVNLAGKSIIEIEKEKEVHIEAIIRNGKFVIPLPDRKIRNNDTLAFIVKKGVKLKL